MESLAEEFARDRQQAYRAYRDGDFATALRLFRALEAYIATLPNQTRENLSQEWRELALMINRLERIVRAATGIQTNRLEWQRPALTTPDT